MTFFVRAPSGEIKLAMALEGYFRTSDLAYILGVRQNTVQKWARCGYVHQIIVRNCVFVHLGDALVYRNFSSRYLHNFNRLYGFRPALQKQVLGKACSEKQVLFKSKP